MQGYRRKDWFKEALLISLLLHVLLISGSFFMKIVYPERRAFKVTMYTDHVTKSVNNEDSTLSLRHHFNETLIDVHAKTLLEYNESLVVNSSSLEDTDVLGTSDLLVESSIRAPEVGVLMNSSESFYDIVADSSSTADISVVDNFMGESDHDVVSFKRDSPVLPVIEDLQTVKEQQEQLEKTNLFTPQYSLQLFGRKVEKEPDFSFLLEQELYANILFMRVRLSILADGSVSEILILGDGSGNTELDSFITESLLKMIFNDISLERNTKQIGVLTLYFS